MADYDRSDRGRFAVLKRARRVWAIAAIHGEVERLVGLHRALADAFEVGDRIVYLGNYFGGGTDVVGLSMNCCPSAGR
jgi:serine/threonine protein phosphatase 1